MNTLKKTLAVLAAITLMLPASLGTGSVSFAAETDSKFEIVTECPEEPAYTVIYKFVDGNTGEPVEVDNVHFIKMVVDGTPCDWEITSDKSEVKIENLRRLTEQCYYELSVSYPEEYGANPYVFYMNPRRSDEPQIREIKLYKAGEEPSSTYYSSKYSLIFRDKYSGVCPDGVKAKLIDKYVFEETGEEQVLAFWESDGEDCIWRLEDYVDDDRYFNPAYLFSVEVPEGYKSIDKQEIVFNEKDDYPKTIYLESDDGCDTNISFVDAETGEPITNGKVFLSYDGDYQIDEWDLSETPVKTFENLKAVEGGGWYKLKILRDNDVMASENYWFRIDENKKEQDVVIELGKKQIMSYLTVMFNDRIPDSCQSEFEVSLILVDGDEETTLLNWSQSIFSSEDISIIQPKNDDAYYKLRIKAPDDYKPVEDYIIDADLSVYSNILAAIDVEKNENRTVKIQFVDGDTYEPITDVTATLFTNPFGSAEFIEKRVITDKNGTEFSNLKKLEGGKYGLAADLPDEYNDQVYTFNFKDDFDSFGIVCKAYKKNSTKRFSGCVARFSILNAVNKLPLEGAKATLFAHTDGEMPAEIANWTVDNIYDFQYIDGLKSNTVYSLYIDSNVKYSGKEIEEVTFSFDKDGEFKEIVSEVEPETALDRYIALFDFDTKEPVEFVSAQIYEKNAFGEFLIKEFEGKTLSEEINLEDLHNDRNRKYVVKAVLPEKYSTVNLEKTDGFIDFQINYVGYGDEVKGNGDANCDNIVNMADVVLIMQSLANPDKYGINGTDLSHITDKGLENADIYGNGDGITNSDALAIQKKLLCITD